LHKCSLCHPPYGVPVLAASSATCYTLVILIMKHLYTFIVMTWRASQTIPFPEEAQRFERQLASQGFDAMTTSELAEMAAKNKKITLMVQKTSKLPKNGGLTKQPVKSRLEIQNEQEERKEKRHGGY